MQGQAPHRFAMIIQLWNRHAVRLVALVTLLTLTACGASARRSSRAASPLAAGPRMARAEAAPPPPMLSSEADAVATESLDYEQPVSSTASEAPAPAPPMHPAAIPSKPKLAQNAISAEAGPPSRQHHERATDAVSIQQVLIYTADFRMAVFDVEASMDKIEQMARSLGGFLARRSSTEIVIRVPAAQFHRAVDGTVQLGDVIERDIQVQDVTEQVTDLMLRLRNARQVRDRIAELLAKSNSVKDSLRIERELARLSEQIERLEGRLKLLRNRAAYSTLTVRFEKKGNDTDKTAPFHLPFAWLDGLGLSRLMNLNY